MIFILELFSLIFRSTLLHTAKKGELSSASPNYISQQTVEQLSPWSLSLLSWMGHLSFTRIRSIGITSWPFLVHRMWVETLEKWKWKILAWPNAIAVVNAIMMVQIINVRKYLIIFGNYVELITIHRKSLL